jgi:hypothetical protein
MSSRPLQEVRKDPKAWRDMMVRVIIATQAREGITTTKEQAEAAWDKR